MKAKVGIICLFPVFYTVFLDYIFDLDFVLLILFLIYVCSRWQNVDFFYGCAV